MGNLLPMQEVEIAIEALEIPGPGTGGDGRAATGVVHETGRASGKTR